MQNAASVGQAQRSRKNSLLVAGLGAALVASALTIAMTAGQLSSAASAQGAQQRRPGPAALDDSNDDYWRYRSFSRSRPPFASNCLDHTTSKRSCFRYRVPYRERSQRGSL